jgi:hypothetical protein
MRKTFPLEDPPHKPPQVVAAIKNKVRKYLKRERRKALPEGVDFWDFDCQVGQEGPTKVVHVAEIIGAIDAAAENGWATVYIEILAKPGKRTRKPRPTSQEQAEPSGSEPSGSEPSGSEPSGSEPSGSDAP